MYDRIVLPTDGSEGSERAIDHAVDLAGAVGGRLYVLSVVDDDEFRALEGIDPAEVREEREAVVEAAADRARAAGVEVETAVREGVPSETVLAYADEVGADAIVMGTHGRSGVDRVLLGSVTERVVRAASVPVITVRLSADDGGVESAAEARDLATEALADAGHDGVEVVEDPHRTRGSWIVPARTDDGTYHVHVDVEDGGVRIASLSG